MDEVYSNLWKQGPLVGVLIIVGLGMYRYFIKESEKKDALIAKRDEKIENLTQQFMDVIRETTIGQGKLYNVLDRMDRKLETDLDLTSLEAVKKNR